MVFRWRLQLVWVSHANLALADRPLWWSDSFGARGQRGVPRVPTAQHPDVTQNHPIFLFHHTVAMVVEWWTPRRPANQPSCLLLDVWAYSLSFNSHDNSVRVMFCFTNENLRLLEVSIWQLQHPKSQLCVLSCSVSLLPFLFIYSLLGLISTV